MRARRTGAMAPMVDGWYSTLRGVRNPGEAAASLPLLPRLPPRLTWWLMHHRPTRGVLFLLISFTHPTVAMTREAPGWRTLLWGRALFGRRRKLVALQFILHQRQHALRRPYHALDRWAVRRALLRAQAMTEAECHQLTEHYGLPGRFEYVPWPRGRDLPASLPPEPAEPLVLCAGRAYCDWETVLTAAAGAGWPLVVVFGEHDRRVVERLAPDAGAVTHCELPEGEFLELLSSATVSVVAIRPGAASRGQIRVMQASSRGVALVVTESEGIAGYATDGETALVVPNGSPGALRAAVDRLLSDDDLRRGIRQRAFEAAQQWSEEAYFDVLADLVHGRPVVLPPFAPRASCAASPA